MGNFKIGNKVKFIGSRKDDGGFQDLKTGKVYNVQENSFKDAVPVIIDEVGDEVSLDDYRCDAFELVESKPSKKQRIETLEKEVSELKLIVHELRGRKETVIDIKLDLPSTDISVEDKQADVIEFEGQQYRKVERKAVEGDVVVFQNNNVYYDSDKPYKVIEENRVFDNDGDKINVYNAFNRTPDAVDVYEPINQPVQRQTVECESQLPFDDVEDLPYEPTPNELRAEVIEKAKAFFETNNGNEFVFSVDEDKRTAFCWKLVSNGCGYNTIHGLSTCHPNDVFNEHIGKAIALGRALGLDVSEFEQAVQPSELTVGMVVTSSSVFGSGVVKEIKPEGYIRHEEGYTTTKGEWTYISNATITNDTNAIYGGVE